MELNQTLNPKQQSIIHIAAFTASGDLSKLEIALQEGLAAGLTVNEIKEILGPSLRLYGFSTQSKWNQYL
jgi:4-carboxymuconolactone decarboxylase